MTNLIDVMQVTPTSTPTRTIPDWAYEVCPCLKDSPYAAEAGEFVAAALALDAKPSFTVAKLLASFNIVHAKRRIEEYRDREPTVPFRRALVENAALLRAVASADCGVAYPLIGNQAATTDEEKTAEHYGNLFSDFDEFRYFEEPVKLLRQRLERNDYPIDKFPRWRALDAGCGNGRYTFALRKLGMMEVVGIDLSEINIRDAQRRLEQTRIDGVTFRQATALALPYGDESFDFVFSNGVLHHTSDCAAGVKELLRVMKGGGVGFLKLIGAPGGIHWDHCEILRVALNGISYNSAREFFATLGVPSNLRYLFLDHVFAPINHRYSKDEVAAMLRDAGAVNLRWLARGADFDLTERTFNGEPYADVKYGLGEHRYYFEKP